MTRTPHTTRRRPPRSLLQRLRGVPLFVLLWLPPTLVMLSAWKLLLKAVPFRRLAPLLGEPLGQAAWLPLLSAAQQRRAQRIRRVIALGVRLTPWEVNCFPQALVARTLLGLYRIPYLFCFGMSRSPAPSTGEPFAAHAWVEAGPTAVSGGRGFYRYALLACYLGRGGSGPSATPKG